MRVFGDVLDFLRKSILRDTATPYLWTNETLCECIAQAHDTFAERTLCIRDSSSIAASFELEVGVDVYPLHPTVISVMSGKVAGEDNSLVRASASAFDGYVPPPDTVMWLENINYGAVQEGTPKAYSTDDSVAGEGGATTIRVWPTPAAADAGKEVKLRVTRLPLVQCSMDTLDELPDCPRQSLMGLAHGAAAIAYEMQDSDGGDGTRAALQRDRFDKAIEDAKRAARHKMFTPLSWGFGRGGFSHSR